MRIASAVLGLCVRGFVAIDRESDRTATALFGDERARGV
jgi:hypothetical protein